MFHGCQLQELSACRRSPTEADDVAVGVLDIEVLRAPRRRRERLHDLYAVRDTLLVERFDAIDAGRRIEMLMVAPPSPFRQTLWRFLQVKFQSVNLANGVEPVPWLAEGESELLVV